jgi:hypothetical protein
MSLYFEVTVPGLTSLEGLEYNPGRPARHCKICGRSFQPALARSDKWLTSAEAQLTVEILLKNWATYHNRTHSSREHESFQKSGRFLSPEATEKLVPLGIIPVSDIVTDDEVRHAGLLAPRAPKDDTEA